MKADWYKVFGIRPLVVQKLPDSWKGPAIYIGKLNNSPVEVDTRIITAKEAYILRSQPDHARRNVIVATGTDKRGIIYAAYSFAEEVLGVDPQYYWTDNEPIQRKDICVDSGFDKSSGPPTFTYRGWFINDEDLLNTFASDPMRENVISLAMYDRIYETILRLKGNMVVPASHPFPDERCHELAARRGLVLNMHHVIVLGLNTYRWPNKDVFSYSSNKEFMEKRWQTCIDAYRDYEVVWTVGYRGKHDKPFWKDVKGFETDKARGEMISKVIARQVEMVRAKSPDAAIIANMWFEGAQLYHKGHIKLPEDVILVWPDNGVGTIEDKGTVKAGQGIYYHVAMMNYNSNQLTELVPPNLIYEEVGRFAKADATRYILVNTSDIRPVPLSVDCVMKMVWNAEPYLKDTPEVAQEKFYRNWCSRQYGEKAAEDTAKLYERYFNMPRMYEELRRGEHVFHMRVYKMGHQSDKNIADGKPVPQMLIKNHMADAAKLIPYVDDLLKDANAMESSIPESRKDFYRGHLITQLKIQKQSMLCQKHFCAALIAYNASDTKAAVEHAEKSVKAYEGIFAAMHEAEYGKWAGWYRGEGFEQIHQGYDLSRRLLARLEGQDGLLIRKPHRKYNFIYQYQVPFSENFPLLYPDA